MPTEGLKAVVILPCAILPRPRHFVDLKINYTQMRRQYLMGMVVVCAKR